MPADSLIPPALQRRIQDVLDDWNSSDFILAVVERDEDGNFREEYASFGSNQYDPKTTMYSIASNTKQFTAIMIGLLIEDEEAKDRFPLGWRTPLKSVLTDFELADAMATEHLTFADALSHVSGLPRHDMMNGDVAEKGREDLLHKLRYLPSSVDFREAWQYNNQFYDIMALVPQLLKNQSFSHYLQENIFKKAGFAKTTFDLEEAEEWGLMDGYFATNQHNSTLIPTGEHWAKSQSRAFKILRGAGGIISNAQDMATWVKILLSDGRDPSTGKTVVPTHILKHVKQARAVMKGEGEWPELGVISYGLGFMRLSYRGHDMVEHGGGLPGYLSQITHLPNDGLGLVLFSNDNENGDKMHQIIKHVLLDHLLGLNDIDWSTRFKEKKVKDLKAKHEKAQNLQNPPFHTIPSVGSTYSHPAYGHFILGSFDPDNIEDNELISQEDVQAVISWIDEPMAKHSSPYGLIRADKLFGKYLLLRHKQQDTYNLTMLGIVAHRGMKTAFAVETYSRGRVTLVKDGMVFDGNFWGAEEEQARPLADPAKGEVYFHKVAGSP